MALAAVRQMMSRLAVSACSKDEILRIIWPPASKPIAIATATPTRRARLSCSRVLRRSRIIRKNSAMTPTMVAAKPARFRLIAQEIADDQFVGRRVDLRHEIRPVGFAHESRPVHGQPPGHDEVVSEAAALLIVEIRPCVEDRPQARPPELRDERRGLDRHEKRRQHVARGAVEDLAHDRLPQPVDAAHRRIGETDLQVGPGAAQQRVAIGIGQLQVGRENGAAQQLGTIEVMARHGIDGDGPVERVDAGRDRSSVERPSELQVTDDRVGLLCLPGALRDRPRHHGDSSTAHQHERAQQPVQHKRQRRFPHSDAMSAGPLRRCRCSMSKTFPAPYTAICRGSRNRRRRGILQRAHLHIDIGGDADTGRARESTP